MVSPDGSRIAYIATRAENQVWVMGANGEQPRRLIEAAPGERFLHLQWSPDGQRIAFMKSSADVQSADVLLQVQAVAGGLPETVLTSPDLRSFCWSPDGRLFLSLEEPPPHRGDMNLWQVRLDGPGKAPGRPQRITHWAGFSALDLSMTADGKRLVFVNSGLQSDVYEAELEAGRIREEPRRATLDERNDVPSAWSSDASTLYFYSDRNGTSDIFKQRWQSRQPQAVALGQGEQADARLSPDGSWLLYWEFERTGPVVSQSVRLLRMPVAGGSAELVLEARAGAAFRCAVSRPVCLLSEPDKSNQELVFTAFTVASGRGQEVLRLASDPAGSPRWDLSPNGSTIAITDLDDQKHRIRLVEWETGSGTSVVTDPANRLSGVTWMPAGTAMLVTATSVRRSALLHVEPQGRIQQLWTGPTLLQAPVVAPDGRRLAFSVSTRNSNVWVVEGF